MDFMPMGIRDVLAGGICCSLRGLVLFQHLLPLSYLSFSPPFFPPSLDPVALLQLIR